MVFQTLWSRLADISKYSATLKSINCNIILKKKKKHDKSFLLLKVKKETKVESWN